MRADDQRGDWFSIPEVADAYGAVQAEFRAGRRHDTEAALAFFRRVVLTCNDLLPKDARKLADKVQMLYDTQGTGRVTRSGGATLGLPDLEEIDLYVID